MKENTSAVVSEVEGDSSVPHLPMAGFNEAYISWMGKSHFGTMVDELIEGVLYAQGKRAPGKV